MKPELPDDIDALKVLIAERDLVIAEHATTIAAKDHRIAILSRIAFGKSSEKRRYSALPDDVIGQGHLFHAELVAEAERTALAKKVQGEIVLTPPKRSSNRKGRRAKFPAHLPRVTTSYELEDDVCVCGNCGGSLHKIGEESTRELERLETAIVHEIRRAKYACRDCTDGVTTAPGPDRAIEKGILGPGFLAHVAVERFANHMPYNRLEKKYATEGLSLSRSVLERSMKTCAELLTPICEQLKKEVLSSPVIFTDDTSVTIARPSGRAGSRKGNVWIYLDREGRHFYESTDSREGKHPQAILSGYEGAIHADAYAGYDKLFAEGGATEVACWAHTRRKFIEAETTEPELAKEAINRIRELYAVEREAKDRKLNDEKRRALRQEKSIVIIDELFAWMAKTESEVLPQGPMGKALRYALKLEVSLRSFLNDGRLEADNNAAERALRSVAVGRKNWLFFQTEGGGDNAAVMLSLVMSAKAAGLDPKVYLRDVLLRIGREVDVTKLTPHGWRKHFQEKVEAEKQAVMARFLGN